MLRRFSNIFFSPKISLLLFILSSITCFAKIYLSNITTLSGYKIGELKEQESLLLKKRNLLTMELTSMLRKKNLLKKIKTQ